MTRYPCKFCGRPTLSYELMTCDDCWEVHTRLDSMPLETIEAILVAINPEVLIKAQAEGFKRGLEYERSRASVYPDHGDMGG